MSTHKQAKNSSCSDENDIPVSLDAGTRAALLQLSYEEAMRALEAEEAAAVALVTEYILAYSEKTGEILKAGKDYLELLAPKPELPAIERIAMELVLETVEEELDEEEA